MRLQRVIEAVNSRPWFISAQGFAAVKSLLDKAMVSPKASIADDLAPDIADLVRPRPDMIFDEATGIAKIHVFGVLGQHLSRLEKTCGNTDYAQIIGETTEARGKGARAIIYIFDSPGGMCLGCDEAAQAIANAGVPTIAWSDSLACSAAYYLAAGCHRIIATRSAIIGNIGVICPWVDTSEMWAIEGVSFEPITSDGADLKATFHGPSLTESQRDFVQSDINQIGSLFRDHVVTWRPGVDSEVWRAGWYSGEKALEYGLIDEIGDLSQALQPFLPAASIQIS